jgi:hypothetical protein
MIRSFAIIIVVPATCTLMFQVLGVSEGRWCTTSGFAGSVTSRMLTPPLVKCPAMT